MKKYIVTLRFDKNKDHNPHDKKTGICILSNNCTDVTGEHHSYLIKGYDEDHVRHQVLKNFSPNWVGFKHITRIEEVC